MSYLTIVVALLLGPSPSRPGMRDLATLDAAQQAVTVQAQAARTCPMVADAGQGPLAALLPAG